MTYEKKYLSLLFLLISYICSSCLLTENRPYPYIIDSINCLIQEDVQKSKSMSFEFDFYNTSIKQIQNIEIQFFVYDYETKQNPFKASNLFKINYATEIQSQKFKRIFIPLNSLITEFPNNPYLIDHLIILKILYSDGSIWENPESVLQVNL